MTAVAQRAERTGRMKIHTVRGGGGLRLHVREWGKADGPPILFIHGWSQNHLCWAKQYESALADEFRLVAYDLRGHGMSEAPLEPEHYTDGELWADDVAAIIDAAAPRPAGARRLVLRRLRHLRLRPRVRPGSDRRDQLRRGRRQARRGGVRHADRPRLPRPLRRTPRPTTCRPTSGPCAPSCGRALAKPVPADDFETALCWNIVVPAPDPRQSRRPRDRLRRRAARARGAAARHARAGRTRSCCRRWPSTSSPPARPPRRPGTTASATLPHLEEPERFNRELAALTRRVLGQAR